MDWQQMAALLIVAATIAAFVGSRQWKRKSGALGEPCDCDHSASVETPPSTVLRGRKGERPQLVVKLK